MLNEQQETSVEYLINCYLEGLIERSCWLKRTPDALVRRL